jgi:hypothetical protein
MLDELQYFCKSKLLLGKHLATPPQYREESLLQIKDFP